MDHTDGATVRVVYLGWRQRFEALVKGYVMVEVMPVLVKTKPFEVYHSDTTSDDLRCKSCGNSVNIKRSKMICPYCGSNMT